MVPTIDTDHSNDQYYVLLSMLSNKVHAELPPLPPSPSRSSVSTITTSCNNLKTHHRIESRTATEDNDGLFYRLQEENAKLPPQDSTAFILAQIERQNVLLEKDPKSIYIQSNELKAHFSTVQRLVKDNIDDDDEEEEIDWGFWEAVIQDSDQVALRLPHLLSLKLRSGIPRRVRGLMWQAMSKSASLHLEKVYDQLCKEKSPQERIIQRDLARTFPRIDMFKQENGQGQSSMKRILEAYSLYDTEVGYCQGLAFLVGPLLMNMTETQSFCVFVRLMETYEMRSMFTLNMEGLQLRLYQFQCLLKEILPDLSHYLDQHGIHSAMYASQWFLTLFAYGFPITLVARIYDIIFAEGAAETIMRVAIAMLKRSQEQILHDVNPEFENILDYVTSRKLCEPYMDNYGNVVRDAMALSGIITRDRMDRLSEEYYQKTIDGQQEQVVLAATAGRFGFWKRRKRHNSKKSDVKRSASTGGVVSTNGTLPPSKPAPRTAALKKRWSSVSSPRDWAFNNATTHSFSRDVEYAAKLEQTLRELEDLKKTHKQTLGDLLEVQYDKQDLSCERDALKLTITELERNHRSDKREYCDSPIMLPGRSFSDLTVADDRDTPDSVFTKSNNSSISTSRRNSIHVSSSSTPVMGVRTSTNKSYGASEYDYDIDVPISTIQDEDQELSSQLVHIKVRNFELEQECEKLSYDLEALQLKFDMVNEGQMALADKIVDMTTEMDNVKTKMREKSLAYHDLQEENQELRLELNRVKERFVTLSTSDAIVTQQPGHVRRHSMTSISLVNLENRCIRNLEASLTASKIKLAEYEFVQTFASNPPEKKKTSLYGRVLQAFSRTSTSTANTRNTSSSHNHSSKGVLT